MTEKKSEKKATKKAKPAAKKAKASAAPEAEAAQAAAPAGISLDVMNTKGEKTGTADLSEKIFNFKAPIAVVHEVVNGYLAGLRRGTHSTKTRGEVSGGGVKPWKQKHTGRARSGSTRSPLWRHGGIIFGPKPRSYYQDISPEKRRIALRKVLSDILKEGRLKVVESVQISEPKTKRVADIVKKLAWPEKTLLVVDQLDAAFARASRNVASLQVCRAIDLNTYDAMAAEQVVFTKPALDALTQRLEN